jgi:hypothetical protein
MFPEFRKTCEAVQFFSFSTTSSRGTPSGPAIVHAERRRTEIFVPLAHRLGGDKTMRIELTAGE